MKKIRLIWIVTGLLGFTTIIHAQSGINIEGSQLFTKFKFYDSQSTPLSSEYSGIFTGAYGIGYGFIADNGIMFRTGIGMRKAGATMVYDDMNYSWNLQYANFKLGGGYMLKKDNISPYLNVSGYFAYLLRGFQTINNEDFNIKESDAIEVIDFGIYITPGVQFTLSDAISAFIEFSYIMGLKNLEVDEGQKSSNTAFGLSLGISFAFNK